MGHGCTVADEPLAVMARQSFAHGWVLTNGPMTARVQAAYRVALDYARAHGEAPGVLETVMRLGAMEGTLARVHQRREQLYAQHIAAVITAYRTLTSRLDLPDAVHRFRRAVGLTETSAEDTERRRQIDAAAAVEATRLTHQAVADVGSPDYRATVTAISDGLLDAEAEGTAGAVATLAQHTGHIGVDFDLAFTDARDSLRALGTHWADAQGWLGRIVNGNAADLGRVLADSLEAGDDFDAMLTAARGAFDDEDIRAVETLMDLAMGQSVSRGALTLYGREGVTSVDFLAAGGTRVCILCLNAESGNPWSLTEVPKPSLHPSCRCSLAPSTDSIIALSSSLARYVTA